MKLAAVWWKDAHACDDSWLPLAPLEGTDHDPYLVLSVGFLLTRRQGRKRGHISIARSVTRDGNLDAVLHIPRGMVVSRTDLGDVTPPHRRQDG